MKRKVFIRVGIAILVVMCFSACGKSDDIIGTGGEKEQESIVTDVKEATADTDGTIAKEIQLVEIEEEKMSSNLSDSASQTDMNELSGSLYKLWDDELNSLWSRFSDEADADYKEKILKEQRAWIKNKERKIEFASKEYEGGSIYPLILNSSAMEITRARCYVLGQYLAELRNESFNLEIPEEEGIYYYVDKQGTDEIYSELLMAESMAEGYDAEIGLYRLTTLVGIATKENDSTFSFIDYETGVEGTIELDSNNSASFTVTSCENGLLSENDTFYFDEKM